MSQRQSCYYLCKCINCMYVSIRNCCCICGCCCTAFWTLLFWALISLSISIDDIDWSTTDNTCYHKLNVTPEATQKEIQKAFRKLALKYHPDKVPKEKQEESQKIFQEISHCYDILNDEKSRKQYDANGYRETNEYGIPFDGDINLKDIFDFFYENFDFQFNEESNDSNHKKGRKKRKTERKTRNLNDYTINLKLEDILFDKEQIINIGDNEYIINIPKGIPNGYIIEDELNGFKWRINVEQWDNNKIWKRGNDNDFHLYSNRTITIDDVLMGSDIEILMIDGKSMSFNFNMKEYDDYRKILEIKNNGLPKFKSKRKYKNRGTAFVHFDILYPKLDEKQKKKLQQFLKSNGKWSYHKREHNEL